MADTKIIRGYWDCIYCGTKRIDGLKDICPNCGKQKSQDVKYYMGSPTDVVTGEELKKAGISKEECDGKHEDWVCPYCQQLNNWSDTSCVACAAPKEESKQNYGEVKKTEQKSEPEWKPASEQTPLREENSVNNKPANLLGKKKLFLGLGLGFLLLVFLLFPTKKITTVSGFSWQREVTIEEYMTYSESDWNLPKGARLTDSQTELYGYESVLDHTETVTEEKSRQVVTGYDTVTSYTDNGNGTFSETSTQVPIYGTEYYTETSEKPVYRDEPVYKTKYYYDIDRWTELTTYESEGNDHEPYWNTEYRLKELQRDDMKKGEYEVEYVTKGRTSKKEVDYEEWKSLKIGDQEEITTCLLGIEYNSTKISSKNT